MEKLVETVTRFPNTEVWMDSCGEKELNYGIPRGITGSTSNPTIIGTVIVNELDLWKPRIRALAEEYPSATEDELAWKLMYEISALRAKKLLPLFKDSKGKRGRLSTQTNAKFYRSADKLLEQALEINSLAENMEVKIPASEAGIKAIENATYYGISVNATLGFTTAQEIAVAEAVERGLKRREAEGLSIEQMNPVCTLMIGRDDAWIREWASEHSYIMDPEIFDWAGIAIMKECYRIYKERGYRTRLLVAAFRNHRHWSQMIGGDVVLTIPYTLQSKFNSSNIRVKAQIEDP